MQLVKSAANHDSWHAQEGWLISTVFIIELKNYENVQNIAQPGLILPASCNNYIYASENVSTCL